MHIIKNEYLHVDKNEYLHENNQDLNKNGSMATMAEKMAASLEELRKLQEKDRCVVLQGTAEMISLCLRLISSSCSIEGSTACPVASSFAIQYLFLMI